MPLYRTQKSVGLVALLLSVVMGNAEAQNGQAPPKTPECVPVPEGMVAWWPGDGGVRDRLGRSRAQEGEGLDYTKGKVGTAFLFDAADAFVKIPPLEDLEIGTGLSIYCWIRPATTAFYPIVEWNNGQGLAGVHLWLYDGAGRLFFNIIGVKGESHIIGTGPGIIKVGEYQHIAATYDIETGLARLYRNGVLMAEDYMGKFEPQTSYDLYLGTRPRDVHRFKGEMDEVCLFNRSLTARDIQAVYEAHSAGHCLPEAKE